MSDTSVQLASLAEVRFDRLFSRVFQSHHCNRLERNTLRPSSVGWRGVVVFSFELRVSGFSETNWMETLRIRDRMPNVLFDREHRIRFSLSVLPSAIGDSSMANMMDEQETCPCLFCCTLTSWSRSLPCLSARGASASSLAAPKVGTSFRATYGENVSCFLVDSAAWNVFSAVTSEVRRVSVCSMSIR